MTEDKSKSVSMLRQELLEIQERRHAYSLRKLSFVVALFGLGSVSLDQINSALVLYFIPVVALAFDLYILTEDYRIKRIGEFLRQEESSTTVQERAWWNWARTYANPLAPFTSLLVTLIVLLSAAVMLWIGNPSQWFFWLWVCGNLAANAGLVAYAIRIRRRFANK